MKLGEIRQPNHQEIITKNDNTTKNNTDNDDDQQEQEMRPVSSPAATDQANLLESPDKKFVVSSHNNNNNGVVETYQSTDNVDGGTNHNNISNNNNQNEEQEKSFLDKIRSISRHGLGIFLIILVAIIWVSSSEFLQFVFGSENFDKPYFVTYFNTMSFALWMFGFACPGASGFGKNPLQKDKNNNNNKKKNRISSSRQNHDDDDAVDDDDQRETAAILGGNEESRRNKDQSSSTKTSTATSSTTRRTITQTIGPETPPPLKTEMKSNLATKDGGEEAPAAPALPFGSNNNNSNNTAQNSVDVNGSAASSSQERQDEHGDKSRNNGDNGHTDDVQEEEVEPYSVLEIAYAAFLFCPLWFFANVLFNYSLSRTSVASNTILSSTSCIWAMLFSRLLLKEPVTLQKIFALTISFGGAFMVGFGDDNNSNSSGGDDPNNSSSNMEGNILAGVSAMFYAAYTTVLRHCLPDERRYPIGMCFAFVGVLNAILLWPGLILLNYLGVEDFEWPSGRVTGFLIINGLIGTNLSDILWAKSVILTSPLIATLGLSLTTPVAMIADLVLRGKWHSVLYLCGAVCVMAGFIIANLECGNNEDDNDNKNEDDDGRIEAPE